MNRQQAINYLLSSGFSEEQINTIEQAFKQEPTTKNDIRACKSCVYSKDGKCAGTEECHLCMWENQYTPTTKNDLGVDTNKLLADCEKMSFDIEIFNKPLKVVALDAVKNIAKDLINSENPNKSEILTGSTTKNDLAVAEMIKLVRESDVIDRTDGSELAKAFNYLFDRYIEEPITKNYLGVSSGLEKNSKKLEKNFGELDCISRAEMLKYQEYLHGKMSNEENHKLWEFIKELPPVTPQPKHGIWQQINKNEVNVIPEYRCSECGAEYKGFGFDFDYCPRCGCAMEEEE